MKILDSSVIIAFFRIREENHKKAVSIFFKEDSFVVPDYVFSEVLTVLKQKEGLETVRKCTDFLMNTKNVEMQTIDLEVFSEAMKFFVSQKNKLSFVDTLLLIFSKFKNYPLLTFDKELGKMAK